MSRLRIVVLGYVVRGPLGGVSWHPAQYVTGLLDMGHDVVFLEDSGDDRWCCYDPSRGVTDTDPSYGLRYAEDLFSRIGVDGRWSYYDAHTRCWLGPLRDTASQWCRNADLVLNISGINPLRHGLENIPLRVYVDTDPVFTQIRNMQEEDRRSLTFAHNRFFSFGENLDMLPPDGFPWQPTRQPMDLRFWPKTAGAPDGRFTTVMQWESYSAREYRGQLYGMKSAGFSPYMELPRKVQSRLEMSLGGPNAPRQLMLESGWCLRNPLETAKTPWAFQEYLRGSKAEFAVAKHGYAVSACGWFSDRTAAYLATGRPVVVQDTGFRTWLPACGGVFAFATPEEAVEAIREVERHYDEHCRLARQVAEEYFAAETVLGHLLERALGSRP